MEPGGGDRSSQSPAASFDASSLLGGSPYGVSVSTSGFSHLSQMPSAFSMMGRLPMFPPTVPFGGLGSISDPLRSPGSLAQPLSPTGGADWWRLASEHARRLAMGCPSSDYIAGLNGGVSDTMFQLPSFSTTTTTTTTTTSASSSTGGATKSGVTVSSSLAPSRSSSTPSKSHDYDKDCERKSTPNDTTRHREEKKRRESGSSESKDDRLHKSSSNWSTNPLSVESLTNAETASAVMGTPPFFFPFGTVASTMPTFSALPFTSPLLPEVSSVYSGSGLFPAVPPGLFQPPPSVETSKSFSPGKSSTPSSSHKDEPPKSTKSVHSVISSLKSSCPVDQKSFSERKTTETKSPTELKSSSLFKTKDIEAYRERVLSPTKSLHTSVITSVPKSPASTGHDKRHHMDQSAIEAMDRRYGSRRSPRFDRTAHQSRSESNRHESSHHESSHRESSRPKESQSSPHKLCERRNSHETDSALNLSRSSSYAMEYSQDGAIDLSMKKPRSSVSSVSPVTSVSSVSSAPHASAKSSLSKDSYKSASSSKTSPSSTKTMSKSSSHSVPPTSSMSNSLAGFDPTSLAGFDPASLASSLFSFPGATDALSATALMEAQKDMLEKHAAASMGLFPPGLLSGAGGKMAADMSFNYAAAAAMMPPFYDGMAGMLLHPMMASMAAAAMPPVASPQAISPPTGRSRGGGRGRGRGGRGSRGSGSRGGRGRTSSIPNPMMHMFKTPDPPRVESTHSPSDPPRRGGRARGRGRGGRGRRGGRGVMSSSSVTPPHFMGLPLAELEWQQQRLRQEQMRHQLEVEMKQQQMQVKLAQRAQALRDKDSKLYHSQSESSSYGHSSRLAQALMGSESVPGTSQKLESCSPFKTKSLSDETSASGTGEDYTEDSGSDSDSQSAQDSETSGSGHKRGHGEDYDSSKKKRRRTIFDETELRIPLEHGWRRETKIREVNERGIFGEVIYYSPCDKKLRTYPEVEKYMIRNDITDLTRSNFTFSTQVGVGDFFEERPGAPGESMVLLTEGEVLERYVMIEAKRKRIWERKVRIERRKDRKRLAEEMARRMAEARIQKKVEQQGNEFDLARKVEEIKMRKKAERQQQREAIRRAKQVRVLELKKLRERQRVMKQQEKVQKQRQILVEREMRAQQAVQARQKRKEELQSLRFAEAIRKAQDKEMKRQQSNVHKDQSALSALLEPKPITSHPSSSAVLTSLAQSSVSSTQGAGSMSSITATSTSAPGDMYYTYLMAQAAQQERARQQHMLKMLGFEKERRRQHLLLLKAMDARKKLEEKERQKEEKKTEKRILQQRKLEQRRLELEMAREMKKPVEDMRLKDSKPLPDLSRIPGVRLSGEALADCIMVVEFMQNFGSCLGYDSVNLPTLNMIQGGLLNDPYHVDDLNMFVMQLLRNALDDPGVPNPREATTASGQKIMEVDLNEHSISEVLRIFIRCRNGKADEMSVRLKDQPFQSQTPTHKAAILAFLCNELLCGRNISGEIDKNIETINNLRRDKWIVEGKLRKVKMIQAKIFRKAEMAKIQDEGSALPNMEGDDILSLAPPGSKDKKHTDDEEDNESGHESDGVTDAVVISDDDEEENLTSEELEKKVEKLGKQHLSFNDKVTTTANKLRAINLGQDRYKRRYWVLPHCGGVFVEGMESGELGSDASLRSVWLEHERLANVKEEEKENVQDVKVQVQGEGHVKDNTIECLAVKVKSEVKSETDSKTSSDKTVNGLVDDKPHVEQTELQNGARQVLDDLALKASSVASGKSLGIDAILNGGCTGVVHSKSISTDKSNAEKPPSSTPHLVNGDSGTVPLVNGTILLEPPVCGKDRPNVPPPPLVPFKISLIKDIIDKNIAGKSSRLDGVPLVNGLLTENCDLKSPLKVKDMDLKVMDLTTKVKVQVDDIKRDPGFVGHNKDDSKPLNELNSMKMESVFSQFDSKVVVKSPPTLKVPVLKSPLSGMSYRSIDSILNTDSKPALSSSGLYSKSNRGSSIMTTSSPHLAADHLMKNMSVAVSNNGELIFQNTKPAFSPWISLIPREPCDKYSHAGKTRLSSPCKALTPRFTPQGFSSPMNSSLYRSFDFSHLASPMSSAATTPNTSIYNLSLLSTPKTPNSSLLLPPEIDHTSPIYMLQQLQYPTSQPISFNNQKNWWQISDLEMLRELMRCLHLRGIRERSLQKTIERFMDLTTSSITKGKKEVIKLDPGPVSTCSNESPMPEHDLDWRPDIGREVELGVLDEVENMEDRICHASLQVKGFKMPAKVRNDDMSRLVSQDVTELKEGQVYILDVARTKLLGLERNIERRYLKPPFSKSMRLSLASLTSTPPKESHREREPEAGEPHIVEPHTGEPHTGEPHTGEPHTVEPHSQELHRIDEGMEGIEPLESDNIPNNHLGEPQREPQAEPQREPQQLFEGDEEMDGNRHLPKELTRWRQSVLSADSASQIMVYMLQLNDCISWEKSIMKVSCQICCHDDNEAELLLCDSCDKGYHTYCFRPKMSDIPDGDWYCYECISRATGEACCVVCGKAGTKLAECEYCPRSMHTDCMDPPLTRCPKRWCCAACSVERGKGLKKKKHRLTSMSSLASFAAIKETINLEAKVNVNDKAEAVTPRSQTPLSNIASTVPDKPAESSPEKKEKKKRKKDKDQKDVEIKSPKAKVKKPKKEKKSPEKTPKEKKPPKEKKRKSDSVPLENNTLETPPKKKRKKKKKKISPEKVEEVIVIEDKEKEEIPAPLIMPLEFEEVLTDSMDEAKLVIDLGDDSSAAEEPIGMEDSTDLSPCICMMDELDKHEESWPFLHPVDCRRFPSYKKIIKKPMDFQTMRRKLRDNVYQSREEFANDLRVVCDNCVTFNEDDSAVGRAGHAIRAFFEKRWKELCINSIGNDLSL